MKSKTAWSAGVAPIIVLLLVATACAGTVELTTEPVGDEPVQVDPSPSPTLGAPEPIVLGPTPPAADRVVVDVEPTPTVVATPTAVPTPTPTAIPTPLPTATPEPTPTPAVEPTPVPMPTNAELEETETLSTGDVVVLLASAFGCIPERQPSLGGEADGEQVACATRSGSVLGVPREDQGSAGQFALAVGFQASLEPDAKCAIRFVYRNWTFLMFHDDPAAGITAIQDEVDPLLFERCGAAGVGTGIEELFEEVTESPCVQNFFYVESLVIARTSQRIGARDEPAQAVHGFGCELVTGRAVGAGFTYLQFASSDDTQAWAIWAGNEEPECSHMLVVNEWVVRSGTPRSDDRMVELSEYQALRANTPIVPSHVQWCE